MWYIPGGKREAGESDHEALIREVKEELSVNLKPNTITYFNTFQAKAHGKSKGIMIKMTCYIASFTGSITPASEIQSIDFLGYKQKDKTSPVDHLIFEKLYQKQLIED